MSKKKVLRVAVVGSPSTEQWLLAKAFEATRSRACTYELVTDPTDRSADIYVVDSEENDAIARWSQRDPLGTIPAAFFVKVPARAKSAVAVARPITASRVVDSLDQIYRRFLSDSGESTISRVGFDRELLPAGA